MASRTGKKYIKESFPKFTRDLPGKDRKFARPTVDLLTGHSRLNKHEFDRGNHLQMVSDRRGNLTIFSMQMRWTSKNKNTRSRKSTGRKLYAEHIQGLTEIINNTKLIKLVL